MLLNNHILRHVESNGNRTAMIAGNRRWTYSDFQQSVQKLANGLSALGIRPGDRIALLLCNSPELVLAYYACFRSGAIAVPVNNRFVSAEIEYSLNHSECRVCISQPDLYEKLVPIRSCLTKLEHVFLVDGDPGLFSGVCGFSDLLESKAQDAEFPDFPEETIAAILYTSGTTSRPIGVTHTHRSLDATARNHAAHLGLKSHDVTCVIPPMCHILGFAMQLLTTLWAGATIVVIPDSSPETILSTIETQRATRIAALPTLYQSLIDYPHSDRYNIRSLRTCIGGGDAVPLALQESLLLKFRAGSNISPLEVEEVIYQHPSIRECGVVGAPDKSFGEVVWAYVATRTPTTSEELQNFTRQKLAPYKVPEEIR